MFIINQDRDERILFEEEKIHIFTVTSENRLWGFNLMSGEEDILGFFNTLEKAEAERDKILNYDREYFVVDGFDETYEYEPEDEDEWEIYRDEENDDDNSI